MSTSRLYRLLPVIAAVLLSIYLAVLIRHVCAAAGGADSSGYLNEARMLSRGILTEPVAGLRLLHLDDSAINLFLPLGFIPGPRPATMVPSYPAGLPAHMVLAARIGGWTLAPFLISPLAAAGSVLLFLIIARMLGLPRWWGACGALILALCPVVLFQAIQPMSDVLAMFWAMAMIASALAARHRSWMALLAGGAFGMGVAVRPTSAVLIVPLLVALELRPKTILMAAAGALPFAIATAAINRAIYGSPFQTGYGSLLTVLHFSGFAQRGADYIFWLARQLTPLIVVGIFIIFDRRQRLFDRMMLFSWFAVLFGFYIFYEPSASETWWYTRFLLPAIPPLILAALLIWHDLIATLISRKGRAVRVDPPNHGSAKFRATTAIAAAALVLIVSTEIPFVRREQILHMNKSESVYPETVAFAEKVIPQRSLIAVMQMSGAFQYYSHRPTVRWDILDADRFQSLRASAFNSHLAWYAVLFPFEESQFRSHMPGRWTLIGTNRDITIWKLETD